MSTSASRSFIILQDPIFPLEIHFLSFQLLIPKMTWSIFQMVTHLRNSAIYCCQTIYRFLMSFCVAWIIVRPTISLSLYRIVLMRLPKYVEYFVSHSSMLKWPLNALYKVNYYNEIIHLFRIILGKRVRVGIMVNH